MSGRAGARASSTSTPGSFLRLALGAGNDVLVNTFTNNCQVNPAVATLANGNVVVAWGSFNQVSASSLQDVYAQLLSPRGQKVGGEFLVNQFTSYNQRTPAVAALSGGGFVVVWVSEQERVTDAAGMPSVDIYGRLYNAGGAAVGDEFLVNTGTNHLRQPKRGGERGRRLHGGLGSERTW